MIIGIIQASGFSTRMKEDKLLLEIDGIKVIERVVKACKESNLDDVILIYRRDEVKEIGNKYNIRTIYNEKAHLGQSEGLKLGVKEAEGSTAYMFLVGDQPLLTSTIIDKLLKEYKESNSTILVPYYNGNKGMPMIISSEFKEELLKIVGDKGGRDIVKDNIHIVKKVYFEDENLGVDIDTQEDIHRLRGGPISKK
ncbi:nucleotidyltransferase family protein [Tissierella sp.]|uniref:nucleotidyltransferase family protein n=1 Tax=Tissierella sp. TaxID=41274 RepID=UPI00286399DC|nr:nucleotidyltransferase family protein [Tissierella sp.]MDR7855637.1 nucleotidyltransferase family protein [Tissierella sp.]